MSVRNKPRPLPVKRSKPKFKVGDRIKFRYVFNYLHGHIEEYRGPLARGGVHLYTVVSDVLDELDGARVLELPEPQIEFE